MRWYPGDLDPGAGALAAICIGVPVAAGLAAAATLRRVRREPLNVTRRGTPSRPTVRRLIPLALGLLVLGSFALAGHTYDRGASSTYTPTIVAGFVLVLVGIVAAGPWLTLATTRILAARLGRAPALIARRRIADDPAAAFRAVNGLVLAVFIGSVFVAGTATASSGTTLSGDSAADRTAITRPLGPTARGDAVLVSTLRSVRGVLGTAVVHSWPQQVNGFPQGVVDCRQLATTADIGRCAAPSGVVVLPLYALDAGHTQPGTTWHPPTPPVTSLDRLPINAVVIATDGSQGALERVRTRLDVAFPDSFSLPVTLGEVSAATRRDAAQLQHLGNLAILLSVIIAGASLAVSVAGGVVERRRPFALLRLAGMPMSGLQRILLMEAALPLLILTAVSAAAGLLTAELILRAVRGLSIRLPDVSYYLTLAGGIAAALALVTSTMPLLQRISAPEAARSE